MPFYAVARGWQTGVFHSWSDAERHVLGEGVVPHIQLSRFEDDEGPRLCFRGGGGDHRGEAVLVVVLRGGPPSAGGRALGRPPPRRSGSSRAALA